MHRHVPRAESPQDGDVYLCQDWYNAAKKAKSAAERLYTQNMRQSDNTRSSAFQHAYCAALAVNRGPGGPGGRRDAHVNAHESNTLAVPQVNRSENKRIEPTGRSCAASGA